MNMISKAATEPTAESFSEFVRERNKAFATHQKGLFLRMITDAVLYPKYRSFPYFENFLQSSGLLEEAQWNGSIRRRVKCRNWPGIEFVVLQSSHTTQLIEMLKSKWLPGLVEASRGLSKNVEQHEKPFALLIYAESETGRPPNRLLAFVCRDLGEYRHVILGDVVTASKGSKEPIDITFSKFEDHSGTFIAYATEWQSISSTENSRLSGHSERTPISATKPSFMTRFIEFIDEKFGGRYSGTTNLMSMIICISMLAGAMTMFMGNIIGAYIYAMSFPLFLLISLRASSPRQTN